ncbi:tripartite transporter large subunit [Agaricicola taiwanensis]|uniref:TRAP transporter large permease protein n=1 Tax=Agaricicola taiwanensis TaxID=591372 RepID=A0A8J2VM46_9RHOB|nr:TRAP transporter large permease subunit [Agaricicola taiwanensis]GGE31744.1 tripartite transporter large subunit [Agaricicola taiwanensis]
MSGEIVSLVTIGLLLLLLATGIPLAFATGTTAVILTLWLFGPESLYFIPSRMFTLMNNYALISVPLFVLMGCILEGAGVVERLFHVLHIWSGRLRGGLAVGTLLASTVLAAMVGVIGAEIVVLGLVCLPAMLKRQYDRGLAVGVICAGGSLGTLLPPSIVLIVYGLVAQVSIGELFLAAVLPGFLLVGLYLTYVLIRCYRNPALGPLASDEELSMPLGEKLLLGRALFLPLALITTVLGSLYLGIATPTETAAVGVLGAIIIALVNRKLTWDMIYSAVKTTGSTVAMLTWIFFGASALVAVYTLAGGTSFLQGAITGLPVAPIVTVGIMMLILIVLGCFIDWIGIVLLTMPIFVPVIRQLGFDPIWFGVLFTMNMQVSYLTPPFGAAAFYLKAVAPPEITLSDIFRAVVPFIGLQLIGLALVMSFPQIALWLPALLK